MLGVNSEQKESYATLCIPDSIYGLTLAWVTSENSTKQLECRLILTRSSFTGPYLLCTVSGVDRPCPWFYTNCPELLSPTNSLSRPLTTSGYGEISGPKNPLSGFAPKQTKESSAWRATYIVLQYDYMYINLVIVKW